jgi:crossover junction endodeoxyribonuclease RuvC
MKVLGLDLSLTSSGVAVVESGTGVVYTEAIKTKGKKNDTLRERHERHAYILTRIQEIIEEHSPQYIVIEGPAYASSVGKLHDRSGLWWIVVFTLMNDLYKVSEVPPTNRAQYATGKGRVPKEVVVAAVAEHMSTVVKTDDEADAIVLACMALRSLGKPADSIPEVNWIALKKVDWEW